MSNAPSGRRGSTPALSPVDQQVVVERGPARADRRPWSTRIARQPTLGGGCGVRLALIVLAVATAAVACRRRAVARGADTPRTLTPGAGQHGDHGGPARWEPDERARARARARPPASRTCSTPRAPAASCCRRRARRRSARSSSAVAETRAPRRRRRSRAIVMLESAGRPDAQASNDLDGAVGPDADPRRDRPEPARHARRRAPQRAADARHPARHGSVAAAPARAPPGRRALRPRQGDRGDRALPADRQASASAATTSPSPSYHMGDRQHAERARRLRHGATSPTRSSSSTPRRCATRGRGAILAALGDDSSTYLLAGHGGRGDHAPVPRGPRRARAPGGAAGPQGVGRGGAAPVATARAPFARPVRGRPRPRGRRSSPASTRRRWRGAGVRIDRAMGELAGRLHQSPRLYRALRPQALRILEVIGAGHARDRRTPARSS